MTKKVTVNMVDKFRSSSTHTSEIKSEKEKKKKIDRTPLNRMGFISSDVEQTSTTALFSIYLTEYHL